MIITMKRYTYYINKLLTLMLCTFFVMTFLPSYFSGINEYVFWYGAFVLSFAIFLLSIRQSHIGLLYREAIVYSLVLILFFLSIIINKNVPFSSFIQYLRYIFIALSLRRIRIDSKTVCLFYYAFCFYFIASLILGIDPSTLVHGVSRNVISIHLLSLLILYFLSLDWVKNKDKSTKKMMIASLAALILNIWTGCRSGVVAMGVILVGLCFVGNMRKRIKNILAFLIILLVAGYWIISNYENSDIQRFLFHIIGKESIKDNPRWEYIKGYFELIKSDMVAILFGGKLKNLAIIADTEYNLHNSFVAGHARMGLPFITWMIYRIIVSLYQYYKKNKIYMYMLLALMLRAFTDTVAFNGLYDIFFYYFVFELFLMNDYHNSNNKVRAIEGLKVQKATNSRISKNRNRGECRIRTSRKQWRTNDMSF